MQVRLGGRSDWGLGVAGVENGNGSFAPALPPETWLILSQDTQGQFAVWESRLQATPSWIPWPQQPGPTSHCGWNCIKCLTSNYVIRYRVCFWGLREFQFLLWSSSVQQNILQWQRRSRSLHCPVQQPLPSRNHRALRIWHGIFNLHFFYLSSHFG